MWTRRSVKLLLPTAAAPTHPEPTIVESSTVKPVPDGSPFTSPRITELRMVVPERTSSREQLKSRRS
jgi:hypothetical protein